MFNSKPVSRKRFFSNPPLSDLPQVVPDEHDGVVCNKVVYVPQSNHSYFEGVHFSAETMSLRAKLNLGVNLQQVSIGQIENDPNVLARRSALFEQSIQSRLAEIEQQDAVAPVNESPEPIKTE